MESKSKHRRSPGNTKRQALGKPARVMELIAAVVFMIVLPLLASGQTPIIDPTGGVVGVASSSNVTYGFNFTLSNNLTISGLGLFDVAGASLTEPHAVGLWDSGGNLLASTVIDNSSTPIAAASPLGRWLENTIKPITLSPGTYVMGAFYTALSPDFVFFQATAPPMSGVSFGNTLFVTSEPGLSIPTNIQPFNNVGVFGPMAFQSCGVNVTGVKMFDSHTLQVDVTGQFSQDPLSQKSLGVSMSLNSTPLSSLFPIPSGSTGTQSESLFIDLVANQVPRFTDNMRFPITAQLTEGGSSCSAVSNGIILLPTVIVAGILNSDGGDHTFTTLEQTLTTLTFTNAIGQPYQLRSNPQLSLGSCASNGVETYPTLYTLGYRTSKASFSEGAIDLSSCIRDIKNLTYADQVNIVTHSKGGLVARQYLFVQNSATVHHLIMAQPPNVGAIAANWTASFPSIFIDLHNLLPLWPWKRANDKQLFRFTQNEELTRLNQNTLPGNVVYTIIYSTSTNTAITETRKTPDVFNALPGDGVVPAFSQRGLIVDPNDLTIPPTLIPAFDGVPISLVQIPGGHIGYLESQGVMPEIIHQLIP